jgi:hypothetical protein
MLIKLFNDQIFENIGVFMSKFRILGTILCVVGIVLVVFGIVATQKTGEKVVNEVTGHYTDKTMWYILGGIALIIGGAGITRIKR